MKRWCSFCKTEIPEGKGIGFHKEMVYKLFAMFCDGTCQELYEEEKIRKVKEEVRDMNYKERVAGREAADNIPEWGNPYDRKKHRREGDDA